MLPHDCDTAVEFSSTHTMANDKHLVLKGLTQHAESYLNIARVQTYFAMLCLRYCNSSLDHPYLLFASDNSCFHRPSWLLIVQLWANTVYRVFWRPFQG